MSMVKKESALPTRSTYIARAEFIEVTGIHPARLEELMEMGWIASAKAGDDGYLFRGKDIYRVRKFERICCDFELPVLGGTIIVDLLERIAELENKVKKFEDLNR
ncbi:MAG: chaperone modulator CbpM [Desulfovibrionaceae bacterium]